VHTAGVVIGDMDVNLTRLPKAPEAYIAFPDMVAGQNGVRFKARLSYLTASVKSAAYMVPGGAIAAMRRWKALSPDEQAQFEAIYRAAWADGWQDTAAAAAAGHPVLREPVAGEVYSAVWLENWQGAAPGVLTRVDFRVEADGKTAIAREHDSKILLMQNPAPIGS